jgi:hypothetical protein
LSELVAEQLDGCGDGVILGREMSEVHLRAYETLQIIW